MRPEPDLTAPLSDAEHARLELPGGVYHLRLRSLDSSAPPGGDPYREPPDLFRARFDGPVPQVSVHDGTVRIHYPRFRFFQSANRSGEIALAPSVPWTLAITGGVRKLDGDLRRLTLEGISISGGLSMVRLSLPRPTGTTTIVITGGVHELEILRPAVVPMAMRVTGGIQDLRVDELALGGLGGHFEYVTPGTAGPDRYDIQISGGVAGLRVGREETLALAQTG